jgi:hypothetical protein
MATFDDDPRPEPVDYGNVVVIGLRPNFRPTLGILGDVLVG